MSFTNRILIALDRAISTAFYLGLILVVLVAGLPAHARQIKMHKVSAKAVFGPGIVQPPAPAPGATPIPTNNLIVDLSKIPDLANYNDIYFNRDTLHTYVHRCPPGVGWGVWAKDDCDTAVDTGFTFENATWRSGIDALAHLRWPWLNPLDFATQDTARMLIPWIVSRTANDYPNIEWSINDTAGQVTGPFYRTTYWSICGDDNRNTVNCFSAGQIANKVIRNHPQWARDSWLAEVKAAFSQGSGNNFPMKMGKSKANGKGSDKREVWWWESRESWGDLQSALANHK